MAQPPKFNLPTSHKFKVTIWGKIWPGDRNIYISVLVGSGDMTSAGFFKIKEIEYEENLYWTGIEPLQATMESLKSKVESIRAESARQITEVQREMNKFLQLAAPDENQILDPASDEERRSITPIDVDDDIPF